MVTTSLLSLLMTLLIVTQLARTHGLSSVSTQSDVPAEHPQTTMPKNNESSYLYLIGGSFDLNYITITNSTSRFSTATGEWESMKDMPTERVGFCGAVVDKKIYLFGGKKLRGRTVEMASDDVYDCLTDTYTPLPPMSDYQPSSCSAAVLEQFIYVSGGTIPDDPPGQRVHGNHGYRMLKSLHRLDTRTNQWTTLSPMNKSRSGHQLFELDGLLYAIGGDNVYGNNMEIYNATANKWSISLTKKHFSLGQTGSATLHEGKIYALDYGGFEVNSPETEQWSILTRPERTGELFYYRNLVSMNGKLWAVGGRVDSDSRNHPLFDPKLNENLHSYDPSTGQWTEEQKIDVGRTEFSAFVVNL